MSRLLGGIASAGLLVAAPVSLSHAATVPSAISSVSLRQSVTTVGSAITLDLTWSVPNGTKAGDTFTLELPPELAVLGGTRFDLKNADGTVVASASISGQLVTFTLTDFAEHHIGVKGSAFFSVALRQSVQPGPHDLVFTASGSVFRDRVEVGVRPVNDFSGTATKWAKWLPPGTPGVPANDRIHWAITGPRVTGPAPMTFTDTPGPGQAIDCTSFTVWSGTANLSGQLVGSTFVARDRWKVLECTAAKAVVQFTPVSGDVGRVVMLMGLSSLTDTTLEKYTNSGSVAIGGGAIPVTTVIPGAGGQASGAIPVTPSPGASAPCDCQTATVTVTQPGPTTTVTSTATQPAVTVTESEPFPLPVPGPTETVIVTAPAQTVTVTQPPASGGTTPGPEVTQTVTAPGVTQTVTAPGVTQTVTEPAQTVTTTATATVTTTATATVFVPYPLPVPGSTVTVPGPTVTVTAAPPASGEVTSPARPPGEETSTGATVTVTVTHQPGEGTGTATAPGTATGTHSSSSSSSPPVSAGASVPGTPGSTAPPPAGTPNQAVRPGSPAGAPPPAGTRVTAVNTGIAPDEGSDALLVGGGVVLLAGAGTGLITVSRRRGQGD